MPFDWSILDPTAYSMYQSGPVTSRENLRSPMAQQAMGSSVAPQMQPSAAGSPHIPNPAIPQSPALGGLSSLGGLGSLAHNWLLAKSGTLKNQVQLAELNAGRMALVQEVQKNKRISDAFSKTGETQKEALRDLVSRGLMDPADFFVKYPEEKPVPSLLEAEGYLNADPKVQQAVKDLAEAKRAKTEVNVGTNQKGTAGFEPDYLTEEEKANRNLDPEQDYQWDRASGRAVLANDRTESQNRAYMNYSMMANASNELNDFQDFYPKYDPTNIRDSILLELQAGEGWDARVASKLTSPIAKEYFAIMMPWVASYVQQKSGAQVPMSEIIRELGSMWPGPGDTIRSRAVKSRMRSNAEESVSRVAGISAKERKAFNKRMERQQSYFDRANTPAASEVPKRNLIEEFGLPTEIQRMFPK